MPRKKEQTTSVEKSQSPIEINQETSEALMSCERMCQDLAIMEVGVGKLMAQANALRQMRDVMARPDVREAIMDLKNSPIGFKTDERAGYGEGKYRKKEVKYTYKQVSDAVIQGMMNGVYPIGNQMNVISASCYITKEGLEYKLDTDAQCIDKLESKHIENITYLGYDSNTGMATIGVEIVFKLKGSPQESKEFRVPVKYHPQTGSPDQAFGKAKRKAWAWLFERVTGAKVPDGDVEETVVDNGSIEVEAEIVVDPEPQGLTDDQVEHLHVLLAAPCFNDKTKADYQAAIDNGNITQDNFEKWVGTLTSFLVQNNCEIPKRKGEA